MCAALAPSRSLIPVATPANRRNQPGLRSQTDSVTVHPSSAATMS
jgi:hypothetical protein